MVWKSIKFKVVQVLKKVSESNHVLYDTWRGRWREGGQGELTKETIIGEIYLYF